MQSCFNNEILHGDKEDRIPKCLSINLTEIKFNIKCFFGQLLKNNQNLKKPERSNYKAPAAPFNFSKYFKDFQRFIEHITGYIYLHIYRKEKKTSCLRNPKADQIAPF